MRSHACASPAPPPTQKKKLRPTPHEQCRALARPPPSRRRRLRRRGELGDGDYGFVCISIGLNMGKSPTEVFHKHQSETTMSCKCTMEDDGILALHKFLEGERI